MRLYFFLRKSTDYSLRQHQPLYPQKTNVVKAQNELYMKKFGRIICEPLWADRLLTKNPVREAKTVKHRQNLRKRLHETAFHPLQPFDIL